jgi:hypothetical protein
LRRWARGSKWDSEIIESVVVDDQRTAGLRYGQPRVQALMTAILGFALQVCGFTSRGQ